MCKKLFLVVALSLLLTSAAKADLVGWWKLDDGVGTVAVDSSGYGRDGTITGATWETGKYGSALGFSGSAYVDLPAEAWSSIETQATFTFWAYGDPAAQPQANFIFGAFQDPAINGSRVMSAHVPWSNGDVYFDTGGTTADGYDRMQKTATAEEYAGSWQHWALVKDADAGEQKIYLNGVLWHSATGMTKPMTGVTKFTIGAKPSIENFYLGMMDDVRLYDHVLTEDELLAVLEGAGAAYPYALAPDPADGAMHEATWIGLGWRPGSFAVSHDVYLSDNFDDVNDDDGTGATFRSNQDDVFFFAGFFGAPYPDGLVPGTTYYWRIDEVNDANAASPWKGDVWSFWIPPTKAYDPSPADGSKFVDTDVTLNWTAGLEAKLHYVHFGDNFDDVNNAAVGTPAPTPTFAPGTLELGKTYYWRVDESNPPNAPVKGDVWTFTTLPDIPITDPNLLGWWKLDEAAVAVDWSGHGNHGTLQGDPQGQAGYHGGALAFDGRSDYVSVLLDVSETEYTAALWFKTTNGNCGLMAVVDSDLGGGGHDRHIYLTGGNIKIRLWDTEEIETAGLDLANEFWHHVAYTYGATIGGQRLYVDGVLRASGTKNASDFDWQRGVNIGFSNDAANNYFEGVLDDVRIFDRTLTQDEIKLVMRGDLLVAWDPSPTNGSTADIFAATTMTWSRGDNAAQHDVYFGTGRAAVDAADTSDTTGVYRGRQGLASYTPPEGIQMNSGPYYWRIDEFNTDGTISTGRLWSFSVADYILVEDFESYNDIETGQPGSNLIYETWLDGYGTTTNGSAMGYTVAFQPTMETGTVHGGGQSAPLEYNNTTAAFSEAARTLAAQNWTDHSIQTLSIWFFGDPTNVPGQLYVKINGVKVPYDGPVGNLAQAGWQVWNIDLTSVSANLQSITSLAIGVEGFGAAGILLLDDFRLYPYPREFITPVQPDPAGLVGHWALDGNMQDSSGLGNHGTGGGNPTFVAGVLGSGAVSLDGDDYIAIDGVADDITTNDFTVSAWIRTTQTSDGNVVASNNSASGHDFIIGVDNGNVLVEADSVNLYPPIVNDNRWYMLTYTREGDTANIYVNGFFVGTEQATGNPAGQTRWTIGQEWDAAGTTDPSDFYTGMVDDVRFYNYALSYAEVAGLAGRTGPFDKPF